MFDPMEPQGPAMTFREVFPTNLKPLLISGTVLQLTLPVAHLHGIGAGTAGWLGAHGAYPVNNARVPRPGVPPPSRRLAPLPQH